MIKLTLTIISILFISPQLFPNNLTNQWVPKWKVGDWWIINFQSRFSAVAFQPPARYDPCKIAYGQCQYKVIGTEEIDGEKCYVLERRNPPIDSHFPETRTNNYFGQKDLWLVMEIDYSQQYGKSEPPCTVKYSYPGKYPLANIYATQQMPVFPLVLKGAEAESLAKVHPTPAGYLGQKVSVRKIEDFKNTLNDIEPLDTFPIKKGNCYYVFIEQWGSPDSIKRSEYRQIWTPTLPWYLYHKINAKTDDGRDTLTFRSWLGDYSGWHKKK